SQTPSSKETPNFKSQTSRLQSCRSKLRDCLSLKLGIWCFFGTWFLELGVSSSASHAGDHRSEAGQGRQFMPPKHFQRCVRSVSESARCNSGWGLQFSGEWLSGNSRPHRSRVCELWRCKSSLAHQFQGVEATADRH